MKKERDREKTGKYRECILQDDIEEDISIQFTESIT